MRKLLLSFLIVGCYGCTQNQALLPYQDPSLSAEERAQDLLTRLTLEQKTQLMLSDSPDIPELGIHAFNWWSEALHGCARSGLATVFPQAIGMAASWDDALVEEVFDVASTEQRIKYIEARNAGFVKRYSGLAVWTPNINIFRDPRWGRGQETYGEDPFLTMKMGYSVVRGLQGEASNPHIKIQSPYNKLHACLKHYAIHSGPEYERHVFNATDISNRDLMETYLYAFERLVKTTDVKEVMCAYNAYNGEPCCGSDNLLTQILRNEWGYQGLVVSDCGAIRDFYDGRPGFHNVFPDAASASANAVLSGTDVNCGSSYKHLPEAVESGAITEKELDVSVLRLLKARFEMGDMDNLEQDPWNSIPASELVSEYNQQKALEMARECMTLLQNKNNVLPLSSENMTFAVLGPNANDSLSMWGNYNGFPTHTTTVLDAIKQKVGEKNVQYRKVSEWVSREEFQSVFSQMQSQGQQGMSVNYWNNTQREGTPVTSAQLPSPFQFCTLGNTVFAPGVNLTDFSALYEGTYHADANRKLQMNLFVCGVGTASVLSGNDTICAIEFKTGHGSRNFSKEFNVKANKDYRVEIKYAYNVPSAQLNFDIGYKSATNINEVIRNTQSVSAYIYVGGISPQLEGEEMKVNFEGFKGGDRTSIQLPKVQRETLQALHKTGKPVIFVNMSGSAMGLAPEVESCDAILQAWYPGQAGGTAICDVLFGDYNPAGRLPITFYKDENELPDYHDYNVKGHTYRYYQGKPVFAFGEGLSYSTFSYGTAILALQSAPTQAITSFKDTDKLILSVPVSNTSSRDGEEVVQVYLRNDDDTEGPIYALRGFKRQMIKAGQTVNVEIAMDEVNFRTYQDNTGKMEAAPGNYTLFYGPSSKMEDLKTLKVAIK